MINLRKIKNYKKKQASKKQINKLKIINNFQDKIAKNFFIYSPYFLKMYNPGLIKSYFSTVTSTILLPSKISLVPGAKYFVYSL